MVQLTCSDAGGDCDTVLEGFEDLRVGKRCPECDNKFSMDVRQMLMVEPDTDIEVVCNEDRGDCGTVFESFDELRNGDRCPVCDSKLSMDARKELMKD